MSKQRVSTHDVAVQLNSVLKSTLCPYGFVQVGGVERRGCSRQAFFSRLPGGRSDVGTSVTLRVSGRTAEAPGLPRRMSVVVDVRSSQEITAPPGGIGYAAEVHRTSRFTMHTEEAMSPLFGRMLAANVELAAKMRPGGACGQA